MDESDKQEIYRMLRTFARPSGIAIGIEDPETGTRIEYITTENEVIEMIDNPDFRQGWEYCWTRFRQALLIWIDQREHERQPVDGS